MLLLPFKQTIMNHTYAVFHSNMLTTFASNAHNIFNFIRDSVFYGYSMSMTSFYPVKYGYCQCMNRLGVSRFVEFIVCFKGEPVYPSID
jgi:hypothetical protein